MKKFYFIALIILSLPGYAKVNEARFYIQDNQVIFLQRNNLNDKVLVLTFSGQVFKVIQGHEILKNLAGNEFKSSNKNIKLNHQQVNLSTQMKRNFTLTLTNNIIFVDFEKKDFMSYIGIIWFKGTLMRVEYQESVKSPTSTVTQNIDFLFKEFELNQFNPELFQMNEEMQKVVKDCEMIFNQAAY